ncbi:MAG: S8 family serine peptidase [Elusimicrobia bacterium]|nr:S8 family serine peptidase [Elusimicrobiota bacterium]
MNTRHLSLLAVAALLALPAASRAQTPPDVPEMPFPFPFPLDPDLLSKLVGGGKKSAAPGPDSVAAVHYLQNRGLPPAVFMIDPADAAGKPIRVELYDTAPSSPTPVGRALFDSLQPLSDAQVREISKKKLYVLLSLLKDLAAADAKPSTQAFPEQRDAIRNRVRQVLAMDIPADRDFAGLGTDPKALETAIAERRALIDTLLLAAQALPEDTPELKTVKQGTLARLQEELGQLKTLSFDADGKPLIPQSLFHIVQSLPESSLTERQWRTLFYTYPMGRSLWELRVDRLWRGQVSGKGIRIAILDTGIDREHPSIGSAVTDAANFTSHRYTEEAKTESGVVHKIGEPDFRGEHGSHVASTVHSIAPDAQILNIKVLDEEADNIPEELKHDMTQTITAIYDGLDYVLKYNQAIAAGIQRGEPINVVSMSLGLPNSNTAVGGSARDLLSRKVKELADAGVIVVVAAGNEGNETARRPGLEATAVTVGAADFFGRKASFSSNRSVTDPDSRTLYDIPTVWAPGHDIWAAKYDSKGKYEGKTTTELHQYMSGTSMATPHVAGVVALLLDAAKREGVTLTPAQVQGLLKDSSSPLSGENPYARLGGGNIDPSRAVAMMRERYGRQSVARIPAEAPKFASAGPN